MYPGTRLLEGYKLLRRLAEQLLEYRNVVFDRKSRLGILIKSLIAHRIDIGGLQREGLTV